MTRTAATAGEAKLLVATLAEAYLHPGGDTLAAEHLDGTAPDVLADAALSASSILAGLFTAILDEDALRELTANMRRCGMNNIATGDLRCTCTTH